MHSQLWRDSKLYPWSWSAGLTAYSKMDFLRKFKEDFNICCKYVAHSCASAVCRITRSCAESDSEFAEKTEQITVWLTCTVHAFKNCQNSFTKAGKCKSVVPLKYHWSSPTTWSESQSSNRPKPYTNDMTLVILCVGFHVQAGSVHWGNAPQHTSCPPVKCQGDCGWRMNVRFVWYVGAEPTRSCANIVLCQHRSE